MVTYQPIKVWNPRTISSLVTRSVGFGVSKSCLKLLLSAVPHVSLIWEWDDYRLEIPPNFAILIFNFFLFLTFLTDNFEEENNIKMLLVQCYFFNVGPTSRTSFWPPSMVHILVSIYTSRIALYFEDHCTFDIYLFTTYGYFQYFFPCLNI